MNSELKPTDSGVLKRLHQIEATLRERSVQFERAFDWEHGWSFVVSGRTIAQARTLADIEKLVERWFAEQEAKRSRARAALKNASSRKTKK